MKALEVESLFTLSETLAAPLLESVTYPWEALPKIGAFLLELGASLEEEEYEKRGENVWIAKSAKVAPTASITGPVSSERTPRYVTALLYGGTRWWERAPWWATLQSLKM